MHDGLRAGVNSKNDRLANFGGKLVANLANGVANFIGGFHHVLFEFKEHLYVGVAFAGSAPQIFDAIDRLHGLFNTVKHFTFNRVRRCAGVIDIDHQQWQIDIGNLIDFEFLQCQQPHGHEHDQNDDRDNRLLNAEIRQKHVLLTYFGSSVCTHRKGLSVFQRTACVAQYFFASHQA